MTIGERISAARKGAGLNKSQLAARVGVSHTAVGNWESDASQNISAGNLLKIAEVTGCSARWLLYGTGERENQSGQDKISEPTPPPVAVTSLWQKLTEADKTLIINMMKSLTGKH